MIRAGSLGARGRGAKVVFAVGRTILIIDGHRRLLLVGDCSCIDSFRRRILTATSWPKSKPEPKPCDGVLLLLRTALSSSTIALLHIIICLDLAQESGSLLPFPLAEDSMHYRARHVRVGVQEGRLLELAHVSAVYDMIFGRGFLSGAGEMAAE